MFGAVFHQIQTRSQSCVSLEMERSAIGYQHGFLAGVQLSSGSGLVSFVSLKMERSAIDYRNGFLVAFS